MTLNYSVTLFENHPKCLILSFEFWHGIFKHFVYYLKLTFLVTLFDSKLQVFKTRQIKPFLAFLMKNVNMARFARNVERDIL